LKDILATDEWDAETGDGWHLHLRRTFSPRHLERSRRPVIIVPGYGMNAFIFGFHPRGTSLTRHFAEAGFEVWCANMRRQGSSFPVRRDAGKPSLRALVEYDMTAAIDTVLTHTSTTAKDVAIVGCSLGGALAYAHLGLHPSPRIGALVTMGSPLQWLDVNPMFAFPAKLPRLLAMLRFSGTRRLAATALPLLARVPRLLSLYMNAAHVDLSCAAELSKTVEDIDPRINHDIARWIGAKDMVLRGVNITDEMERQRIPLLVVIGNRDGIVPERSALSVLDAWGGDDKTVLKVGTDQDWYAHADLFIAHDAPTAVFEPVAQWLRKHSAVD
jgi:pimeloyl-ACP methyl ester carboxylesterase